MREGEGKENHTRAVVKTSKNTKNYSKKRKRKRRKNKERKGRERKRNGILNVRLVTFSYIFLRPTPRRIFFPCRSARPRPRQFRGKYVKQNVDDLLRSLSSAGSASRTLSRVYQRGIHPPSDLGVHLRWIYARYICFKVPDSPRASYPPARPTQPLTPTATAHCDFAVFVVPGFAGSHPSRRPPALLFVGPPVLLFFFLASSRVFMRAGWQKRRGYARAGVMARISALDLEQRFSVEEVVLGRPEKKRKGRRGKLKSEKERERERFQLEIKTA